MAQWLKAMVALSVVAGMAGMVGCQAPPPPAPAMHPGYLHALSDLRGARWCLSHQPGDARVFVDEDIGVREIEAAIADLKRAAVDDGENIGAHPPIDVHEHGSRLLKAIELLRKAHQDIEGEEDHPEVRELRHHSFEHIDRAIRAAEAAHAEWLKDVGR